MTQNIPKALDILIVFVAKMVRGLHLFGAALGVTHNPETAAQADLDAAIKAKDEGEAEQAARKAATAARDAIDQAIIRFLGVARELFKAKLGTRYSIEWKQAGFPNKLALSRSMSGRVAQVSSIKLYLEAHPELEVPAVLTATIAGDLQAAAVTAMSELSIALTTQRQKTAERNAAAAQLLKRARALCHELKLLLPANDPRWLEFGFNVPGDLSVPSAPEGLVVTTGAAGEAALSWDHTVHTDRFHIYQQVVGVDTEPVKIETVTETSAELSGLTSGAHVKFYLTAVNAAGESVPSQTVEVVVP